MGRATCAAAGNIGLTAIRHHDGASRRTGRKSGARGQHESQSHRADPRRINRGARGGALITIRSMILSRALPAALLAATLCAQAPEYGPAKGTLVIQGG